MTHKTKAYPAKFATLDEKEGRVEALVSIFGNVDLVGDRVVEGAFTKSIQKWKSSGDPIPVVFSHAWNDPWQHIGVVDELAETSKGLRAVYTLDVGDNPLARQVYKLMQRRSLKEHSFAYETLDERSAKDGANELLELGIIELGPTLKGVNDETELLAVKAVVEQEKAQKTPPWHIDNDNSECNGYAVVADETSKVVGCHETQAGAQRQMDALYANVDDADKSDVEKHAEFFGEHIKAGRTISKKTEDKVRQIRQLADEVLSSVEEQAEEKTTPEEEKPEVKAEDLEHDKAEEAEDHGNGKASDDVLLRLKAQIARYQNQEV